MTNILHLIQNGLVYTAPGPDKFGRTIIYAKGKK